MRWCLADRKWVTIGQKNCRDGQGVSYCCDKDVDASSCYWNTGGGNVACSGSTTCSSSTSRIDLSKRGGMNGDGKGDRLHRCIHNEVLTGPCTTCPTNYMDIAWCCDTKKMAGSVSYLTYRRVSLQVFANVALLIRKPSICPFPWSKTCPFRPLCS
jgi:hypothetical protein